MIKTPKEIGTTTQSAYIVIDEIDAHYQKAKVAGDNRTALDKLKKEN